MTPRLIRLLPRTGLAAVLAAAAAAAAVPREILMQRGRAAMEDGLYPFAETQFTGAAALDATPAEKDESAVWRARALLARRRAAGAVEVLRLRLRELEEARVPADLWYWLGRAHFEAGQLADAERAVHQAWRTGEPGPRFLRLLARTLAAQAKNDEALAVVSAFDARHPGDPEAADNLLDGAALLLEGGDREAGAAALERIVARFGPDPAGYAARLWLARVRIEQQQPADAEAVLAPMVADEAGCEPGLRCEAWLVLAQAREAGGRPAEALAALEGARASCQRPESAGRIALYRARLLVASGDLDAGRAELRAVLPERAGDPLAAAAQLYLAEHLHAAGRHAEAAEEFQRCLEAFPDAPGTGAALLGLGWSLWDLGRHAEAAGAFARAAESADLPDGRREEALVKSADAHLAAGQVQAALEAYGAVGRRYAGGALAKQAALQGGICLERLNRFEDAREAFARVEAEWPADPVAQEAALQTAAMEEAQGRWDAALSVYERMMRAYPRGEAYPRALLGAGLVRYRLGGFREALADFERLTAEFQDSPHAEQASFMRGWCLYLLGDQAQALAICRAFVKRFPGSRWAPEVQFWLGEYHYNRADYARAAASFTELADRFPESPLADRALYWAGRAAAASKEYLGAIEHFTRLARDYPKSPRLADARFAQGDALSELGEFAGAILAFDEIIRQNPGSYLADLAWGRKGDCHFTLGTEEPERYEEALACYRTVRSSPSASDDLKRQAEYKMGRCAERAARPGEAFDHYMNVVYGHLEARERGDIGSPLWFVRSAFGAAALKEREGGWREAVSIYRRVVAAGGAAAVEAQERINRIRLEQWGL